MIDGTTHSEHCWSFGPKHYECALARIAQLKHDLMWLSITAETLADAVDRISDEAMKNTKTRGW